MSLSLAVSLPLSLDYSLTAERRGESTTHIFSLSDSLPIIIIINMHYAGLQSVCTSASVFAHTKALCIFNVNLSEFSVS